MKVQRAVRKQIAWLKLLSQTEAKTEREREMACERKTRETAQR